MLWYARAMLEDHTRPRDLLVALVYLSLLLDNMLLTVVVPVVPDYLLTSEGLVLGDAPEGYQLMGWFRGSGNTSAAKPATATAAQRDPATAGLSQGPGPSRDQPRGGPRPQPGEQILEGNQAGLPSKCNGGNCSSPGSAPGVGGVSVGRFEEEDDEDGGRVGLLLSSKAWVQLGANLVVGSLTASVGTRVTLLAGSVNLVLASILFALGESYGALFAARSLQGVASACIGVSGMCVVAEQFPEEAARSRALGVVLGSIALGVLLGYPMGSILYEFLGKSAPFLVICFLAFFLAMVQLMLLDVRSPNEPSSSAAAAPPPRWGALVSDWPVLLSAGAILLSSSTLAILEPCLPIWLKSSMKPEKWQMGTVFLPDSVGYLLGTHLLGEPALRIGRWRVAAAALMLLGISATLVSSARSLWQLVLPHFGLGLGVGSVDAALVPLLAYLVDTRHGAGYGAVYALQQAAVSLAYALGPMLGGLLMRVVGFPWLMRSVGALSILFCPLLALLARIEDQDPEDLPQRRRSLVSQHVVNYQSGVGASGGGAAPKYTRFGDSDDSD